MNFRDKINIILEPKQQSLSRRIYDFFMLVVIFLSIIPLMFRKATPVLEIIDITCCCIFIIDYILRWMTADLRSNKKAAIAFACYPFNGCAIIDLLSILPTLSILSPSFKLLRFARMAKMLRVFKFLRYYEPLQIMLRVIKQEAKTLLTVLIIAISYMFCTALLIYNVDGEPMIQNFFDAIYWAACTLTTVGYGDVYPVTTTGRIIGMISSVVGIALIALPSGIITSAYLDALRNNGDSL